MNPNNLILMGQRIADLRTKRNMTQQDLASLVGMSRSSIAKFETARRDPGTGTLIQLCYIFQVTSDYLLGMTNNPAIPSNNIHNVE